MEPGTVFILETRSLGVNIRASWNEIVVHSNPSGRSRIVQVKLNPYVIQGENLGSAIFRPAEVPSEGGKAPGRPYVRLRAMRGQMGLTAQTVLSEFHWRAGEGPFPVAWRDTIRITEAFGRWLWEAAPRVAPGATDRRAILTVTNRLRNALAVADPATVSEMFAVKNEEMARALDLSAGEVAAAMQNSFGPFFAASGRRMEPLAEAGIQFAVQAQGRLVGVNDLDGGPALRGNAENVHVQVPITLTCAGDQWVIVR
jgi:hypothetical protein